MVQLAIHSPPWTVRADHTPEDDMVHGHTAVKGGGTVILRARTTCTLVKDVKVNIVLPAWVILPKKKGGAAVHHSTAAASSTQASSPERQQPFSCTLTPCHLLPVTTNHVISWSCCRTGGGGDDDGWREKKEDNSRRPRVFLFSTPCIGIIKVGQLIVCVSMRSA